MASKRCGACGSDDQKVRGERAHPVDPIDVPCDNIFHDTPTKPQASSVERARNRFQQNVLWRIYPMVMRDVAERDLVILIATERADAVNGMHARNCECHGPASYMVDPFTDPRCIAARKEAADDRT